jgi:hypothetical protein
MDAQRSEAVVASESRVDELFAEHLRHMRDELWAIALSHTAMDAPGAQNHVSELRARLEKQPIPAAPELVTVRGVFYPAVLMTPGIWDRPESGEAAPSTEWRSALQNWLFSGFEEWAPSWDINVSSDDGNGGPIFGQLGHGDEAFSLLVAVTGTDAGKLRDELIGEGEMACSVELQCSLVHRRHARATVPKRMRTWGKTFDYCLLVNLDEGHRIERIDAAEPYSGYLWECVSPREWLGEKEVPDLIDVFFIWEHADFTRQEARDYGLDALAHKHAYIERRFGDLALVQKSAPIVPGTPLLATESFYGLVGHGSS